jgi:hypothetical protein
MNWFFWDTAWSLVFGTIAFMTIVGHPDTVVVAYHATDRPPIAGRLPHLRIVMATLLAAAFAALRRRNHGRDI